MAETCENCAVTKGLGKRETERPTYERARMGWDALIVRAGHYVTRWAGKCVVYSVVFVCNPDKAGNFAQFPPRPPAAEGEAGPFSWAC